MPIAAAQTDRDAASRGFTLIEMMVVLAVISTLAAVALSYTQGNGARLSKDRLIAELRSALSARRAEALASGRPASLDLTDFGHERLSITSADGEGREKIIVYPDGTTTGGVLEQAGTPIMQLDWLTGELQNVR